MEEKKTDAKPAEVVETKTIESDKPAQEVKPESESAEEFDAKMETVLAKKLKEKSDQIDEKLAQLNKREKEFREFVRNTEIGGRSGMSSQHVRELTAKEYAERLLKGEVPKDG